MFRRKCLRTEQWLEWVTVREELPRLDRLRRASHLRLCGSCQDIVKGLEHQWSNYQLPDWDVTPSVLNVFGKLQRDETLILKGWKLGKLGTPVRKPAAREGRLLQWASGVGVGLGMAVASVLFGWLPSQTGRPEKAVATMGAKTTEPLAQIRYENQNRVRIHYVRPELIQSIEFETSKDR